MMTTSRPCCGRRRRALHTISYSSSRKVGRSVTVLAARMASKRFSGATAPRSPRPRALTARSPEAISCSPTTAMTGTFWVSAFLICLARRSFPGSTSQRTPAATARLLIDSHIARAASVTGSSRSWVGASQSGKSPAVDSTRIAKKRSSEPKMARCTMMGRCDLSPSGETYVRSKRSGKLKSHCTVEHCHLRPRASRTTMSIFGP
mmetsp:Transcript_26606/g.106582  ORF Transcript_26606/g.106582 Transcript_26606/m.106582 type:complete len:205 (+) Transcript_26606:2012-2626(+)